MGTGSHKAEPRTCPTPTLQKSLLGGFRKSAQAQGIADKASVPPYPTLPETQTSNNECRQAKGRGGLCQKAQGSFQRVHALWRRFYAEGRQGQGAEWVWRTLSARRHLWPGRARLAMLPRHGGINGASIPPPPRLPALEGGSVRPGVRWITGTPGSASGSAIFPGTTGMLLSNLHSTGFVFIIVIQGFLLK